MNSPIALVSAGFFFRKECRTKGDERVVKKLDELLSDELTAINQCMVRSEMCANWGYERLHQAVEKRAK
jgi:bacterioferritin (cytochrome b1)